MRLNPMQLTGRAQDHLQFRGGTGLQRETWEAFDALQSAAAAEGFDLQVASGFRSFDRQLAIWNAKARGERPVHDDDGRPVDVASLDDGQKLEAILRFSALPGGSRHHWGSDLDVYDAAALPQGYQLQLTPAEVADDGIMGPLHRWLDGQLDEQTGFFRPYASDRGGVAVERWHLSYAPLARGCAAELSEQLLGAILGGCELELADSVLATLPELFRRYVQVPGPAG